MNTILSAFSRTIRRNKVAREVINYTRLYSSFSETSTPRKLHQFEFLKEEILKNQIEFSKQYFGDLLKKVSLYKGNIDDNNFDAQFLEATIDCNTFEIGKNYFAYLLSQRGPLNLAVIGKYFKLCYHFRNLCTDAEKNVIVRLYNETREKYSFFDFKTYENLVLGLSITDSWKEAFSVLKKSKEFYEPTSKMYSAVIAAAFLNGSDSIGLDLLEEMANAELKPYPFLYDIWISKSDSNKYVPMVLNFLRKHNLQSPPEFGNALKNIYGGEVTKIINRGVCKKCGFQMPKIELSNEEFELLREAFLKPVLIGKDIYLKSQPTEFEAFKSFLQKTGRVDVVLDGLNVAYSAGFRKSSKKVQANMLKNVVKHFVDQSLHVLVLGRKHMNNWPKASMSYVYDNSSYFLADDLSQDDPLLLYAAMNSGIDTKFVSRDLMRGHKFLLKDANNKRIFSKWQQKNQLFLVYVEDSGRVTLKSHVPYGLSCYQSPDGSWHLPIEEPVLPGVPPNVHNANLNWICLPPIKT